MHSEVVFFNGRVVTMADEKGFTAVLVRDGRIHSLGGDDEIRAQTTPGAQQVNLRGRTLLPGFIDTHVHFVSTGLRLRYMVDLTVARSVNDLLSIVEEAARERPTGEWILGWGFDHSALAEKRYPTLEELDSRAPQHPVLLRRRDGHSCILNSHGIQKIGVSRDTPGFNLNSEGEPTGVLQGRANSEASKQLQELLSDLEVGKEACRAAAAEAASVGLTTVHALTAGDPTGPEGTAIAAAEDQLPVGLVSYFQTTDYASVIQAGLPRIGGCILLDGSMGSQTAALFEPYADNPETDGVLYFQQEEINQFCIEANREGLQIALHAIGDRAIEQALVAYEAALNDTPRKDHRHRIEHFMIPTEEQMQRAARLGVTPAMQPAFEHFWGGQGKLYSARLGPERVMRSSPFRRLVDLGLIVGGGSDSLVTPMNPLLGVQSAVNHPNPAHRVTVMEALRFFTVNGAYQAFEEKEKGSIQPGMRADLVVLGEDPTEVDSGDISSIPVVATVLGGRVVYGQDNLG